MDNTILSRAAGTFGRIIGTIFAKALAVLGDQSPEAVRRNRRALVVATAMIALLIVGSGLLSIVRPGQIRAQLFFADRNYLWLVPESRKYERGDDLVEAIEQMLTDLAAGPVRGGHYPILPDTVRVAAVWTRDATAYVDIDPDIVSALPGGANSELLAVYSIVNTVLHNFRKLKKVQILVGGKRKRTLLGHVRIEDPLRFKPDLIR